MKFVDAENARKRLQFLQHDNTLLFINIHVICNIIVTQSNQTSIHRVYSKAHAHLPHTQPNNKRRINNPKV